MKDFYQRLNVPADADEQTIRSALTSAETQMRSEAEFILLHPARRAVYDRNYRLLRTIAQLRMNLGLNYTRFWARQEYKDFAVEPMFAARPVGKQVNSLMIARAIARAGRGARTKIARPRNWPILLSIAALLVAVLLLLWHFHR